MNIKRGDIVLANLNPVIGSEQGNLRPVLIIQNDLGNMYSPVTIVAPITSKLINGNYPTNVFISAGSFGLEKDSTILFNQIKTIDKVRIIKVLGFIDDKDLLLEVDRAIMISLGVKF